MTTTRSLTKATPLSPELKLIQSLSDYEAILDSDQKTKLRTYRGASPPTVDDVMRFTAEIDSDAARTRKSRQCVGPRLTNVVESVQQFASAMDVVVGGSQSVTACAIWGVLKMSLLVACNFSPCFDYLSVLFMNIGRTCPRCQDLGLLYPKSTRLRAALYEYFVGLVGLCKKAVLFVQKPVIIQLSLKPFFDSEFGGLQQNLDQLAFTIREEASLSSQQEMVKWHKQDASSHKAMIEWQKQSTNNRLLDACSSYNYKTAWKQARKKGNAKWIHSMAEYKQWKENESSSTLWLTGILGSGKTVLSANIVDDLVLTASGAIVAYFFCRYDDVESLQARTILGSIARQIFMRVIQDLASEIPQSEGYSYDTDQILTYLESAFLSNPQKCFIVVDGLDECDTREIKSLLDCLKRMLQFRNLVQVYCSSRSDLPRWAHAMLGAQWNISMPEVNSELEQYIEETLQQRLEEKSLTIGDPEIILTITDALVEKAHGMYLWVEFQIASICSQKTDEDILNALKDLPKDLPETYDRILQKIQKSQFADPAFARKVYALLAAVRRPLTLDALREAVSVEPGVTVLDPRKMVNDILIALICCGSLVIVDEEDFTVRFAHHSVKQYVLSKPTGPGTSQYHVELAEASLCLGDICVTYLNMGIFDKRLERATPKVQISSSMFNGTLPPSNFVTKIALKYLKNRRDTRRDVRFCLEDVASSSVQSTGRTGHNHEEFHFLAYAKENWLFHTKAFRPTRTRGVYNLWCDLIDGKVNVVDLPWAQENSSEVGSMFVSWVTQENHEALACLAFEYLIRTGNADTTEDKVMKLIPSTPIDFQIDIGLLTVPLMSATTRGDERVVRLLLERGADVNAQGGCYGNALQAAASKQNESIVQLLLDHGADVHAQGGRYGNALQAAAMFSNESTAELLLSHGANVNAQGGCYGNALQAAACAKKESIVQLLLDHGADVHAQGGHYGNALQAAARFSNESIIQLLLDHGADVHAQGGHYGNALQAAAMFSNESTAELLLSHGANVNAQGGYYGNALQAAALKQKESIVQLLLDHGADVNAQGGHYGNALQSSLQSSLQRRSSSANTKLLLDKGAMVTAAHFLSAQRVGDQDLVRLLESYSKQVVDNAS